jgi:hypothetical protein
MTESLRDLISEGRTVLPSTCGVCVRPAGNPPWVVVDAERRGVEPICGLLVDLSLSDMSPLTLRCYGHDPLRRWRLLSLVDVEWDHAIPRG